MTETEILVGKLAENASTACRALAGYDSATKAAGLVAAAAAIRADAAAILMANARDMATGAASGLSAAMLDRLLLNPDRIAAIATSVEDVAALPDPVGDTISMHRQPNGLTFRRMRIPIGVIGIIYESRPNVTVDAAALCVRSGNAVILRGGSEAVHSNTALYQAMLKGLANAGLPANIVQLMPTQDREAVGAMLGAAGLIDLIIPRGGKSLVARVQDQAKVPVLAHLDGVNHCYIHASADPDKAVALTVNGKMRRTGVCGSLETVLIDQDFGHPARIIAGLIDAGCEVRGDDMVMELDPRTVGVTDADWGTEYLAPIISVAIVESMDAALAHIAHYGSNHTDVIVAQDSLAAARFTRDVDSAIVMVNASSQFADGGEFGLGAEIGIATGRLHARGPVALEGLTTYKWVVEGTGQVRD